MHSSFYFSTNFTNFLFQGVDIRTKWGLVSLCIGIATLSMLCESFRIVFAQMIYDIKYGSYTKVQRFCRHAVMTVIYMLYLCITYTIMLAVMTFNAYFILSAVLGITFGYYFFSFFGRISTNNYKPVPSHITAEGSISQSVWLPSTLGVICRVTVPKSICGAVSDVDNVNLLDESSNVGCSNASFEENATPVASCFKNATCKADIHVI